MIIRAHDDRFDVIVVGGGHAGCEAALAAARMGARTALLTMEEDKIAQMSCNPAIGGIAKGHLVKEIDALGGEMGRNTDKTGIQFRMLNTRNGPAVRSLRAQCDKKQYRLAMQATLREQPDLTIYRGTVDRIETVGGRVSGVVTGAGARLAAIHLDGNLEVARVCQPLARDRRHDHRDEERQEDRQQSREDGGQEHRGVLPELGQLLAKERGHTRHDGGSESSFTYTSSRGASSGDTV